jgi:hypothetical protein
MCLCPKLVRTLLCGVLLHIQVAQNKFYYILLSWFGFYLRFCSHCSSVMSTSPTCRCIFVRSWNVLICLIFFFFQQILLAAMHCRRIYRFDIFCSFDMPIFLLFYFFNWHCVVNWLLCVMCYLLSSSGILKKSSAGWFI